jgi:hypothetical protein
MRDKVLKQLLTIIPENRNLPYRTTYNFYPLDSASTTHKAYDANTTSEPEPSNLDWSELANSEYTNLWSRSSDNVRHSKTANVSGEYAFMLFRFKIASKAGETRNEPRKQCLKRVVLTFEGFGTAPTGNGLTLKVWDNNSGTWGNPQAGNSGVDETVSITLTENLTNYVDAEGFLYLLAKTTNPSDGVVPAVLYCDFVQATIDVRGVTFCDVHTYEMLTLSMLSVSLQRRNHSHGLAL